LERDLAETIGRHLAREATAGLSLSSESTQRASYYLIASTMPLPSPKMWRSVDVGGAGRERLDFLVPDHDQLLTVEAEVEEILRDDDRPQVSMMVRSLPFETRVWTVEYRADLGDGAEDWIEFKTFWTFTGAADQEIKIEGAVRVVSARGRPRIWEDVTEQEGFARALAAEVAWPMKFPPEPADE
jgi:hypothetical protein